MSYQQRKPGSGRVWKNTRKQNDKQPHFTGKGTDLNGNEIRIAMWEQYKNGQFDGFSVSLSAPQQQQNPTQGGYGGQGQAIPPQGGTPNYGPAQDQPMPDYGDPGPSGPDDYYS